LDKVRRVRKHLLQDGQSAAVGPACLVAVEGATATDLQLGFTSVCAAPGGAENETTSLRAITTRQRCQIGSDDEKRASRERDGKNGSAGHDPSSAFHGNLKPLFFERTMARGKRRRAAAFPLRIRSEAASMQRGRWRQSAVGNCSPASRSAV